MLKEKTNALLINNDKIKIGLSFLFLFIISVVPALIHTQWFTGPLVNAILLLTCVSIGPMEAVIFGLIPSTVAFSVGLLPAPLAPMIPFIMISNALYIAIFYYIYKKSFSLAILLASAIKFAFLYFTVTLLMGNFLTANFLEKLAVMMSWPQFATAMAGGMIAYAILKTKNKFKK